MEIVAYSHYLQRRPVKLFKIWEIVIKQFSSIKMLLLLIQTRIISICFKQPTINPMFKKQNFLLRLIFRTS